MGYHVGFLPPRWWQLRGRPSHNPLGKARICIQLRASTDVSVPACNAPQRPEARPLWVEGKPFQWWQILCCRRGHHLLQLKRLLSHFTKWEHVAARLLPTQPSCNWFSVLQYFTLFPRWGVHWTGLSPAERLRCLLTQPAGGSHAGQQN